MRHAPNLAPPLENAPDAPALQENTAAERTRIAIVEDSETQALILQHLLEREGFSCSFARNGIEALQQLAQEPPSLVISDVHMPEMDGYELCRRIRADARLKSIPVLLLTSLSAPENILEGLSAGADNFIIKPFEPKTFAAHVRYMLASRAAGKHGGPRLGIDVDLWGGRQTICSERAQMLEALFASCDAAARNAEEMRRARDEAERASRAKTELLARIGHELRNPLHIILAASELQALDADDPETRDSLDQIRTAAERLLLLAEEMLDVSRIDFGHPPLRCEPVDWRKVVSDSLRLMEPLAKNRGIRLYQRIAAAGTNRVLSDSQRLGEVLLNLLSNAVKYNRDHGSVVVDSESRPDGLLRIKVTDEGRGIAPDRLQRLFTPYDRLGAESSEIDGVGLGLVLARKLVESMGGMIGVDTHEGLGSTFWIDLPAVSSGRSAVA